MSCTHEEYIRERIEFLEGIIPSFTQELKQLQAQIKDAKKLRLLEFLKSIQPAEIITFHKYMGQAHRFYTYAIVRAPYSWYSTSAMNGVRNPTVDEIANFILRADGTTRQVDKIHVVGETSWADRDYVVG